MIQVGVLIVAYNGTEYLDDCLRSVASADTEAVSVRVYLIDNASTDGTADFVRTKFSDVFVVESHDNLGFAEGNNVLFRQARDDGCEFVYLLNQDTIVDAGFLSESVDYVRDRARVDTVQSLLKLHPETELINTAGNRIHFLGFGLPTCYRFPESEHPESGEIDYPSGAAVLIRVSSVDSDSLFDPSLFMYLEDAQLGWSAHLLGRPPHCCIESVVYHKYVFSTTLGSYYFLERNRWWLLMTHYRLRTLCLLSPALVAMEIGQVIYAIQNGVLKGKLRAVSSFLSPSFLHQMWTSRRHVQQRRIVQDRTILARWSGTLQSPHLRSPLIQWIANPFFACYHRVLCFFVRW